MSLKNVTNVSDYWKLLLSKKTETELFDVSCPDSEYFEAAREAACFKLLLDDVERTDNLDIEFKKMILNGTRVLRSSYGLDTYQLIAISYPDLADVYNELREKATSIGKKRGQ